MEERARERGAADRERLLRVIGTVRRRWRLRTILRGLSVVGGAALAALLLTAYGLELLRFAPGAVLAFRVAAYGVLAVLLYSHLLRPLARRVDDERVALYLEENEPSLKASVLTAVGAGDQGPDPLLERLVGQALARTRAVDFGERVDRGRLYRYSGSLAGVAVLGLGLFVLGPSTLRTGATALFVPTRSAEHLTPFSIRVEPGDTTVARGSDQLVRADLVGFESGDVELVTLDSDGAVGEPRPMFPAEGGGFEHVLLDLDGRLRYFIRSSGVRSSTFTLDVAEIPYVETLELVYRYPAYTGLAPRTVESGGDIAALPGTRVELRASSSVPTPSGRLVRDDSSQLALEPDSAGRLVGEMTVRERGGYRIELQRPDGRMGAASPHYTIDLLDDRPPAAEFEKPGRDTRASPIDEVFLQLRGEDDYGLSALHLVYSVNGSEPDTVSLLGGNGTPVSEVSTGHTLFLEEWSLSPGDVISYHAVARDNRAEEPAETVSDIYFVDVRAFRKEFSAAEQRGGGGGMSSPGGPDQGAYVELQRQIVAATFNLVRDRKRYSNEEWASDLASVALSQERLRDDVSTLVERMQTRMGSTRDEAFRTIAEELPAALDAMDDALEHLEAEDAEDAEDALSPEQTALRHLQRADEAYREVQVQLQQGGRGGGGGQQRPGAEDLADLFELELEQLRDQYETVQRNRRQSASREIDETMERLKELARRQQQEAERQARRMAAGGGAPSGSARQRALAEETEEAARRLERLARERSQPELEESARRLREAADAMRRAAASGRGQGTGAARGAAEQLEEARRLLEEGRTARFREDVDRALDEARRLRRQQDEVAADVGDLAGSEEERAEATRRLRQRKSEMAGDVGDLAGRLDRTAARARREDREAAAPLQEAARGIRENKVAEKLRYSRGLIGREEAERVEAFEDQIGRDLDSLVASLERARERAREAEEGFSLDGALEEARSLAQGMETLGRRLRESSEGTADSRTEEPSPGPGNGGESPDEGRQGEPQAGERSPARNPDGETPDGRSTGDRGGEAGARTGGEASAGGGIRSGGSRGQPPLDAETARQLRREVAERTRDARGLRDRMREAGRETGDLNRALEALRAMDDPRIYEDLEEITRLQEAAVESFQRLEFTLRRELQSREGPPMRLPGSGDVPPEFREMVEEYYRALSGGGGASGGG